MILKKFNTPAGFFKVLVNGYAIKFEIKEGTYDTYYNNSIPLHPKGCYEVTIDVSNLKVGDVIICEYGKGNFSNDGGGEGMENIVGEVGNYTIGIGAPCTDELDYFSFSNWCHTNRGFEFRIVDNPKLSTDYFKNSKIRNNIILNLVWETRDKPYAWEIVSFLTS